jgi:hypothetical protein
MNGGKRYLSLLLLKSPTDHLCDVTWLVVAEESTSTSNDGRVLKYICIYTDIFVTENI